MDTDAATGAGWVIGQALDKVTEKSFHPYQCTR